MTKAELLNHLLGADEDDHAIGTLRIEDLPPTYFRLLIRHHNAKVEYYLTLLPEHQVVLRRKVEQLCIPTEEVFIRKLDDKDQRKSISLELRKANDFYAYRRWVLGRPPLSTIFKNFFRRPFPAFLPKRDRARHCYIIGASGSGKSVTLLALMMKDKRPTANESYPVTSKSTVLLIEPHGDLALDMARQKVFYEDFKAHLENECDDWNLIYFDPTLASDDGKYPVFNPFAIVGGMSERQLDRTAQQFTQAFLAMLGSGQALSLNMATMLHPVLMTLLRLKGSTMKDLLKFLNDDPALVTLGKQSPNEQHRYFFRNRFQTSAFARTKQSVATKVQSLLNHDVFAKCFCSPESTIDLETATRQGKTIIINLAKGKLGAELSSAMGKLFVASLLAIAFNRADSTAKRTPISLVLDECQNFINPAMKTILTEARKYRLQLTLAQQIVGQDMDTELTRCVLGNTAVQGIGKSANYSKDKMATEFGGPVQELSNLQTGQFIWKVASRQPVTVQMTGEYLARACLMTPEQWTELREAMITRYYVSCDQDTVASDKSQLYEEILASQVPVRSLGQDCEPAFPMHHFEEEDL